MTPHGRILVTVELDEIVRNGADVARVLRKVATRLADVSADEMHDVAFPILIEQSPGEPQQGGYVRWKDDER